MGPLIHRPTGCECRARHGLVLVHRLVQLPGLARSAWQHLTTGGGRDVFLASSTARGVTASVTNAIPMRMRWSDR